MSDEPASAAGKLRECETVKHVSGGRGQKDLVAGTDGHRCVRQRHPIRPGQRRIGLKTIPVGWGSPGQEEHVRRGNLEAQLRRDQRYGNIVHKDGAGGVESMKRQDFAGMRGRDGRGELLIGQGL